ncbi:MAG: SurA N-terminal domain-containing protein [Holophagaceae bacterium]
MKRVMSISLGLAFLAGLGCGKVSKDSGPVLATVGAEKITAAEFKDLVERMAPDAGRAKALLEDSDPRQRAQRNELLSNLASAYAVLQVAKREGLDRDPKVQAELKVAMAAAYRRAMIAKRMPATPPEAELRAFYDRVAADAKKAGQAIPGYEEVKPQLGPAWMRDQQQRILGQLEEEIAKKVPTTFADGYAPSALKGF